MFSVYLQFLYTKKGSILLFGYKLVHCNTKIAENTTESNLVQIVISWDIPLLEDKPDEMSHETQGTKIF